MVTRFSWFRRRCSAWGTELWQGGCRARQGPGVGSRLCIEFRERRLEAATVYISASSDKSLIGALLLY